MRVAADLHVHTSVTDGRMSPYEVIDLAARIGLESLVITDHSIVTFEAVLDYAASRQVRLPFPGTEISTFLGSRKHHILLYGPRLLDAGIQRRLRFPIEGKLRTAKLVRDELVRRGHPLPPLEVITASGSAPGKPTPEKQFPSRTAFAWHVARSARLPQSAAYDMVASVFREVEGGADGRPPLKQRYLPTLDVIDLAVSNGLTASLAHPLWECTSAQDIAEVCEDIRVLAEAGLRGTESRSYHHRDLDDHPALLRTRAGLALVPTAGSDFHANGKTELGAAGLRRAEFDEFMALTERGASDVRIA